MCLISCAPLQSDFTDLYWHTAFSSTYIGKWPSLAISCLIFAVIYFVLDIIFIRNLKLFAKGLYKLPIHLAAALLIFTFFATGYFGAASKTPKIDKISNIKNNIGVHKLL